MRVLALDLGSVTGYALLHEDPAPTAAGRFGSWDFDKAEPREARLASLFVTVQVYIRHHKPDVVIYERPFARGLHATRSLWGMAGVVEAVTTLEKLPVLDQVPSKIKKWATGKGTADKDAMIAEAKRRGHNVADDHQADAVLLGLYALDVMEIV